MDNPLENVYLERIRHLRKKIIVSKTAVDGKEIADFTESVVTRVAYLNTVSRQVP